MNIIELYSEIRNHNIKNLILPLVSALFSGIVFIGLLVMSLGDTKVTVIQIIVLLLLACSTAYFGVESVRRLCGIIAPNKSLMLRRLARFGGEEEILVLLNKERKTVGSGRIFITEELLLLDGDPEFATPLEDILNVSCMVNQSLFSLTGRSIAVTDCYGKQRYVNYRQKNADICESDFAALRDRLEKYEKCTFGYSRKNRKYIRENSKQLGS